jgi:hypothetical protein
LSRLLLKPEKKEKQYGSTNIRTNRRTQRVSLAAGCICPRTGQVSALRSSSGDRSMKLYEVEFRAVITLAAQDMQKATLHGTGVIKEESASVLR